MCISAAPAEFSGTTGYLGERSLDGETIHVIGYQNRPTNLSLGPNAMLLHFPSKEPMSDQNVIDMGERSGDLMKDWRERITPSVRSKGLSRGLDFIATNSVQIFDTGIYTVVLSSEPSKIYDALERVPSDKRPQISRELLEWYKKNFPNWSVALCCFKETADTKADPLFWWYKPIDESKLLFPAIDCHTGGVPDMNESVYTDHVIVMNSDQWSDDGKAQKLPKSWMDDYEIPEISRKFFPDEMRIIGRQSTQRMINGDFMITADSLHEQRSQDLGRMKPSATLAH